MKKVLYIGTTNIYGGVGHIMFDLCKNIDKKEFQIDFLYYEDASDEAKEIIHSMGGEFYLVPRYSKKPKLFYSEMKRFYKEHHYDIVHIHASSAMLIMYAFPVWKDITTKIIYHSHTDALKGRANRILHALFKNVLKRVVDCRLAISQMAAIFMYDKDYLKETKILNNGIHLRKFQFDWNARTKIREELNISSQYVLGHVGRFSEEKNHPFLIDIFAAVHKKNPNTILLLIGNGNDEKTIREKVKMYNLEENVIFYGTSNLVDELLCAMDCFVFPSLWEGLGIAAIEAQASGLPVVASRNIPNEARLTETFIYQDLNDPVEKWCDTILQFQEMDIDRKSYSEIVSKSGFDITMVSKEVEKIYINAIKQ